MNKNAKPIFSLLVYFILQIYFNLISLQILKNASSFSTFIFDLVKYLIIIFVLLFINKINLKKAFIDFKGNYKRYLKFVGIYYPISFIVMIVSMYFITKSSSLPENEIMVRSYVTSKFVYNYLITTFIIPLVEEITFRYSFSRIKNKYLYLIISTLVFASLHISATSEIIYLIPYGALGLAFALIFYKSNNVIVSTIAHSLHNFIVYLFV